MSARSRKSKRKISRVTSRRTSSQALGAGRTRSDSRTGPMTALSGPEAVHVSPSRVTTLPGSFLPIRGTSGHIGSLLYASVVLQQSLESKLQQQLTGLTSWPVRWTRLTTPLERRYFRLVLSAPRMNASGYGLLPTPTRRDGRTLRGCEPPPNRGPMAGPPLGWFIANFLGKFDGRLNPIKIGLLMGYPEAVTLLAPSETQFTRRAQRNSLKRFRSTVCD